jgi:hypothetical protein
MIAASSLAFPGSKTLSAWWSQLAPFGPSQLWVGHLFIHRLEVLAEVVQAVAVDGLQLVLLRAFALEESAGSPDFPVLERLDRHLHLGSGVIGRLLGDLRAEGLLLPGDAAALSPSGRAALVQGQYPRRGWQRRELVFVERLRPDGSRALPPHFLALTAAPAQRWQPDAGVGFDLAWVKQSSVQAQAWKQTFAFPEEVQDIADPQDAGIDPPAWQRVAVDRPERLLAALIAVGQGGTEKILVFAAQQDGWLLRGSSPIGALAWPGRQEFPDLAELGNWSRPWQDWCLARQFSTADAQACTLTHGGHRLEVLAPAALHARLATGKSDLLKGDTWLLAGDGYVRAAGNVVLTGP